MMKLHSWFGLTVLIVCSLMVVGSRADSPSPSKISVDGRIRKTSFEFYYALVFGDQDEYMKNARLPIYEIHDGAGVKLDAKGVSQTLAKSREMIAQLKITPDLEKSMLGDMLKNLDEAAVQFNGANTANITFVTKRSKDGDSLATFILYKTDTGWKVISVISDSQAVPPSYYDDLLQSLPKVRQ